MEFGVFDHLDRGAVPLAEFYEARLRQIEAYDQAGFYSYHLAEHHATPLGMAPSPSVFLAAVAQRTKRLRFGPLVYALPLYHPLRLIEEICMLDQMSRGRLDMGFGRGVSPKEHEYYGQDFEDAPRVYAEALEIVTRGLSNKVLNFEGEFFRFREVPMELEPLQKPYPPIWYGAHSTDSAARAARLGLNLVSLDTAAETRALAERYKSVWHETHPGALQMPKIGLGRFVIVAKTEDEALRVARRAYPVWYRSFNYLFERYDIIPANPRPPDFDSIQSIGKGVAGTPEIVTEFLRSQLAETGANYLLGQFAFGDLSLDETLTSLDLFARHVMPELRRAIR